MRGAAVVGGGGVCCTCDPSLGDRDRIAGIFGPEELIHPPPNTVPASAATPVANSVTLEQFIPTMPSPPEDMGDVASTKSVRQRDRAKVFVVEAAEGSPSSVRCQGNQDRPVPLGLEQHAGMLIPHDII